MKFKLLLSIAVLVSLAGCAATSELKRQYDVELLNGAGAGNIDDVKDGLSLGANVNARDASGDTALMRASLDGYGEIVELLIKAGADVNARDSVGDTALSYAAHRGHTSIVEILVKHGASVNTKDKVGMTPLGRASRKGHKDIVEFLKSHGARE